MKYNVSVAVACDTGRIRKINQDNFWCAEQYLDMVNDGLKEVLSASYPAADLPIAAMFDGMGGEQYGEHASFVAASTLNELYPTRGEQNGDVFLDTVCRTANERICQHGEELQVVGNMGTTAALVLFGQKRVHIANVGDSRIYRISDGEMTQISVDHSLACPGRKKAPLTQFLGIPESEFVIAPHAATFPYKTGDRYLLCSDGLTDMVEDEAIADIIQSSDTVAEACEALKDAALEGGGRDNVTVVLCEVTAQKPRGFFARLRKRR